jgi:hypothetical protein
MEWNGYMVVVVGSSSVNANVMGDGAKSEEQNNLMCY